VTPRQERIGVDFCLVVSVAFFIIATWARVSSAG